MRTTDRPKRAWRVAWVVALALAMAACGAPTSPGPTPGDDPGLTELLDAVDAEGNLDVEVSVTVVVGAEVGSLSTSAAGAVEPVLLEVDARTPGGRPFRAVLLGSNESAPAAGFEGALRVRARATDVGGQRVLVGFAAVAGGGAPGADPSFDGFAFLAARPGATLAGPPVGAVYNFDGEARLAGFCTEEHLTGAGLFRNRNASVQVVHAFLALQNDRLGCAPGTQVASDARMHVESEVATTRLGPVLTGYGALQVRRGEVVATLPLFAIGVPERLSEAVRQERFEGAVRAGAIVLDPFAMSELDRVQDGTMFFRTLPPSLAGVAAGDLLVARPYPRLPDGLMRRVSAVRTLATGVAIDTERAEFADLLDSGGFTFDRELGLDDVTAVTALAPGVDLSGFDAVVGDGVGTSQFNLLPTIRFDQEVIDGVRVVGSLSLTVRPVVSFQCGGGLCSDPEIVGKFIATQTSEVALIGEAAFEETRRYDLARINLATITILIPPVPVTITPVIVVSLTLSGSGEVAFEARMEQTLTLEVGIEKPTGGSWQTINELTRTFDFEPPTFEGSIEAEARLAVGGEVLVYGGLLAAGADLGGFVRFTGQLPGNPIWLLEGGVNSFAYFSIDVIVLSYEDEFKLFERTWTIAESVNTPPAVAGLALDSAYVPPASTLGVPSVATTAPVTFSATVSDLEDGDGCCETRWLLTEPGGAVERIDTTAGNPEVEFALDEPGRYELRALTFDALGATDEATLAFDAVAAVTEPTVRLTLKQISVGSPAPGEQATFQARYDDPFDPECCELAWRIRRLTHVVGGVASAIPGRPGLGLGGDEVIAEFRTTSPEFHLRNRAFGREGSYVIEVVPTLAVGGIAPSFDAPAARAITLQVDADAVNPPRINALSVTPNALLRAGDEVLVNWSVDFADPGPDRTIELRERDVASGVSTQLALRVGGGSVVYGHTFATGGDKVLQLIATDDEGLVSTFDLRVSVLPAIEDGFPDGGTRTRFPIFP
jgi:hypothetical protein